MLRQFMMMTSMGLFFLSAVCFGSKPLLYGIASDSASFEIFKQFRKVEINAIETSLSESVNLKVFPSYMDELGAIQKDTKALTFLYAKQVIVPEISKMHNWEKVAQILSIDQDTHKLSNTYSSFLVTAKNSNISNLSDLSNKTLVYYNTESTSNYISIKKLLSDNKITNVRWVKAKNLNQAYTMVESGQADAVGTWHYYFRHNKHKNNLRVFYKINNISNPILYANTNNISLADIQKVRTALRKVDSKMFKFTYR